VISDLVADNRTRVDQNVWIATYGEPSRPKSRLVDVYAAGSDYAQLEPTAESVDAMLDPAVCTFWPWALACS